MDQDQSWDIIKSYLEENNIVSHQIRSFNNFVDKTLKTVVLNTPDLIFNPTKDKLYILKFINIFISRPMDETGSYNLYPEEARKRGMYYSSEVYLELRKEERLLTDIQTPLKVITQKVNIGAIPILIGSDYCNLHNLSVRERILKEECEYDCGGYFIANGSEKAIVGQERMNITMPCVFKRTQQKNSDYYTEVRNISNDNTMTIFRIEYNQDEMSASITPFFKNSKIPLLILFRALGIIEIDDMINLVWNKTEDKRIYDNIKSNLLESSILHEKIVDKKSAIKYLDSLTNHKNSLVAIHKYFLCHIGSDDTSSTRKGYYVGFMINSLLNVVYNIRNQSDRDHYKNKRVDIVGELIAALYKQKYRQLLSEISKKFKQIIDNNTDMIDLSNLITTKITKNLKNAISTGNWGHKNKLGVAQPLLRFNAQSAISNLRRVNTHADKNSKIIAPRHLHNSQINLICPSETPEGGNVGLVKNLTMLSTITIYNSPDSIKLILNCMTLNMYLLEEINPSNLYKYTKIFINGELVCCTDQYKEVVQLLRKLRRNGDILRETSITYDDEIRSILIYTDEGRIIHPVFIVNMKTMELFLTKKDLEDVKSGELTWSMLVMKGVVEYIDAEESENHIIAHTFEELNNERNLLLSGKSYKHYSHCELHPSVMLGVCAGYIPYSNHNQAPRNTYQCLDKNSLVLMGNNEYKHIKDIKKGRRC